MLKVNYSVENTRVGNQVDYDKLTIEVWTDKTITARDAVSLGAKILCDHFTLFTDLSDAAGGTVTVKEREPQQQDKVLEMTIEELDLSSAASTASSAQTSTPSRTSSRKHRTR